MAFNKLPEELKIQVFSQLRIQKKGMLEWDCPESLLNAALCCHTWNELVAPTLYSTFVEKESNTSKFISTILERPDLASYVRIYSSNFPWIDPLKPKLLEPHHVQIEDLVAAACADEGQRELWYGAMFSPYHSSHPIVALVLLLLPNLSTLEFFKETPMGIYTALVFSKAAQLQQCDLRAPYCNLQYVQVTRFSEVTNFFEFIEPFVRLRSLKTLTFENAIMWEDIYNGIEVVTSHITRLSFLRTDIHPHALAPLLERFPNLTYFSYIYSSNTSDGIRYPYVNCSVRDAIMHLQQSLEELIIVDREKDPVEEWESNWNEELHEESGIAQEIEPVSLAFGSLTGFVKLRRLEATVYTLTGPIPRAVFNEGATAVAQCRIEHAARLVESLPESLEKLGLWNCTEVNRGAEKLLFDRRRRGKLQKLKIVELVFSETFDVEDGLWWQTEGEKLGLVVTVRMDRGKDHDGPNCY